MLGLEFLRGTPPQILMEIVALFPQTVIHPVLDSNTITLQEDPRTIVYSIIVLNNENIASGSFDYTIIIKSSKKSI